MRSDGPRGAGCKAGAAARRYVDSPNVGLPQTRSMVPASRTRGRSAVSSTKRADDTWTGRRQAVPSWAETFLRPAKPVPAGAFARDRAGPGAPPRPPLLPLLESYLAGIGELADPVALAGLRPGTHLWLELQRGGRGCGPLTRRVQVRAEDGRPLGCLPPVDAQQLAGLLAAGVTTAARVTAVVPGGFGRPGRIRLMIEAPDAGEEED